MLMLAHSLGLKRSRTSSPQMSTPTFKSWTPQTIQQFVDWNLSDGFVTTTLTRWYNKYTAEGIFHDLDEDLAISLLNQFNLKPIDRKTESLPANKDEIRSKYKRTA